MTAVAIFGALISNALALAAERASLIGADDLFVMQGAIVRSYSDGRCDLVREMVDELDIDDLRPNVMAIAAYCEARGADPEKLFEKAEKLSPTGDLIFVLHAKYLWKKNRAKSKEIWKQALRVARNSYFKEMAEAALEDRDPPESPLRLTTLTGFAQAFIGGLHHTDPRLPDFVFETSEETWSTLTSGELAARRWLSFGSIAFDLKIAHEAFFSSSHLNYLHSELALPIAVHVAPSKDIVFMPLGSYATVGGHAYQATYGLGVKGVVYRANYTQSVLGEVFGDNTLNTKLAPQEGAHYRFTYQWDFNPEHWFLSSLVSIEHVSAKRTGSFLNNTGSFVMSHTDVRIDLKIQRNLRRFNIGLEPEVVYRVDSEASIYRKRGSIELTTNRREDWKVRLRPYAEFEFLAGTRLLAWFEWMRVYSSFGDTDYSNRNFSDNTVGLGLRAALSTY